VGRKRRWGEGGGEERGGSEGSTRLVEPLRTRHDGPASIEEGRSQREEQEVRDGVRALLFEAALAHLGCASEERGDAVARDEQRRLVDLMVGKAPLSHPQDVVERREGHRDEDVVHEEGRVVEGILV